MNPHLSKPSYPCEPITSIPKLALALGVSEQVLIGLSSKASQMYREVLIIKGQKTRVTFDAIGQLKVIQRKIKNQIFQKVKFPDYLHGSLRGRDYVTNALLHVNKKLVICEDVENFFPSVKIQLIVDVWERFFHFSNEVAVLLSLLTTKNGELPQGASTSSYLANLVMWHYEPGVQAKLAGMGITYSRYVDDMVMSSTKYLSEECQSKAIAIIYAMLKIHGLKASRKKHEVYSSSKKMMVTKLLVNRKPSLGRDKRLLIRSEVHHAVKKIQALGAEHPESAVILNKVSQRVGQLGRFHPSMARKLKIKINSVR